MSWLKNAPVLLLSALLLWTNWQRQSQQERLEKQASEIKLAHGQIATLTESLMEQIQMLDELLLQNPPTISRRIGIYNSKSPPPTANYGSEPARWRN